jgi:hypothetical protein
MRIGITPPVGYAVRKLLGKEHHPGAIVHFLTSVPAGQ